MPREHSNIFRTSHNGINLTDNNNNNEKKTRLFIGKVASFHLLTEALKPVDLMTRLWFQEYVCSKYVFGGSECSLFIPLSLPPTRWAYMCVCMFRVTGFLIAKTKKLMRSPWCNKNDKPAFNLISNSLSLSFCIVFAVLNRKPRTQCYGLYC